MDLHPFFQYLSEGAQSMLGNAFFLVVPFLAVSAIAIFIVGVLWHRLQENAILKYEFITIMAHKFRTPLTHIKWISETLLSSEIDPYKKQNLMDLSKSNQKLITLMGTLIELTDTDNKSRASYSFKRASLNSLVRDSAAALKEAFHEKNISFSVSCPEEDIFVNVDKERLESALQTLLENAYTYTPTGMSVEVIVGAKGHRAIVSVTDRGIGIDSDSLQHIFSKFYRTKAARSMDTEGFGIGLFLARSIILRHRGKLEVYSAGSGKGSTFTIVLPKLRK